MTQKEAEYVSLSRDTTETDLKQRREIRSGTAYHIDQVLTHFHALSYVYVVLSPLLNHTWFIQSAVRAAKAGRVLILEGIEKAERNVLPVLNNLLENREMQLDDGRFLMAADRYDKLLLVCSQTEKLPRLANSISTVYSNSILSSHSGTHSRGTWCMETCQGGWELQGHSLGTSCPPLPRQPSGSAPKIQVPSSRHSCSTIQGLFLKFCVK